jgi:hypothetical protein
MTPLVADGNESLLRSDLVERMPGVGGLDGVDALAPRVVRHMARRRGLGSSVEHEQVCCRALAEAPQRRLDVDDHLAWQAPAQVRRQQRVVVVLVR